MELFTTLQLHQEGFRSPVLEMVPKTVGDCFTAILEHVVEKAECDVHA